MRTTNIVAITPGQDVPLADAAAIGQLIRSRRKSLKLTLQSLADSSDLSLTFVHAVEHGKPTAEIGKVFQLLTALGIDLFGRAR